MLAMLTDQTLAAKGPVLADRDEGLEFGGLVCLVLAAARISVTAGIAAAGIVLLVLALGLER